MYAAGVGSGLTVEAIRASLSSLIRGRLQRGRPETAESAWQLFSDSLVRSFKLKERPATVSVEDGHRLVRKGPRGGISVRRYARRPRSPGLHS